MEATDILTPDTLQKCRYEPNGIRGNNFAFVKEKDGIFLNIGISMMQRTDNWQWAICNTNIFTSLGDDAKENVRFDMNITGQITVDNFNKILDGVNLPKFKIQTI